MSIESCRRALLLGGLVCLLAACGDTPAEPLLGTLEWDRIALPAEASEPVLALDVAEGATVKAGNRLLRLDDRRQRARLAQAEAQLAQTQARLDELSSGARSETLDAARAELARARASRDEARDQYARQSELASKQLVARSSLDSARASRERSEAEVAAAEAQLRELSHGSRSEQIAQADAAVQAAQARVDELRLSLAKLDVKAPRDGRVDALPFKAGDQPPLGASVASLLVGAAPYARVFVPESQRAKLREGDQFVLRIRGIEREFHAHVRAIASEAAFTPYYALTGDDASRLVYRAELVLDDAGNLPLPAGLPVQARPAR
jgi:HlyD family secretion protein